MVIAYRVFVDDDFHYQSESERTSHGLFATADEALATCRRIVDEFLIDAFTSGMTAAALYEVYVGFGDDPSIVPVDPERSPAVGFDAWEYARQRCHEITEEERTDP